MWITSAPGPRAFVCLVFLVCSNALARGETVYRGTLMPPDGFEHIPPKGTSIHIVVSENAKGEFTGRIKTMGVDAPLAYVERADGRIVFRGTVGEMAVSAELRYEGLELTGTLNAAQWTFPIIPLSPDRIPRKLTPLGKITTDDWLADLDYLAKTLPETHKDWYSLIDKPSWERAVAQARAVISEGSSEKAVLALVELVASAGDPHTWIPIRGTGAFKYAPVRVRWLTDGVFITAASRSQADVIGTQVVRIGEVPVEKALERLAGVIAWDNDEWKRFMVARLVPIPRLIHAAGLSKSPTRLDLVVRTKTGEERNVRISDRGTPTLRNWSETLSVEVPLWLTDVSKRYHHQVIDNGRTVYFAYNQCTQDPTQPLQEYLSEVMALFKKGGPERLVVDLRNNQGGVSNLLEPLITEIARHPVINQPDRVYVAIGPGTFSSAMLNAIQFRTETRATLIGEPTGGKPNQFGNISIRYLPRSGLQLPISVKYYQLDPRDRPNVAPDVTVKLDSNAFFQGRDPVLDRVLATPIRSKGW